MAACAPQEQRHPCRKPNPAIPGFNHDHNAELWTGILNVTAGGAYTFSASRDDGSPLCLEGEQLVQNDFAQPVTERSGNTTLTFTSPLTYTGSISIRKMGTGTQTFRQSMTLNSLTIDGGGEVVLASRRRG